MTDFNQRVLSDIKAVEDYRRETKKFLRSGDPRVRAEAKRLIAEADRELDSLRRMISKEES